MKKENYQNSQSEELNKIELAQKHNLVNEAKFLFKMYLLTLKRGVQNRISPVKKFSIGNKLINESVIAISDSLLWNLDDNSDNWILTAGKIENLRIASRKINGIEIKANEIFSFWKHLGNPNLGKGFVVGREIREGCIVPTKAGGLCQLSNALYDAALKAGFEIVERHKHTKVIKGSLAELDRDATVKWNYIDLRFKSNSDFRIEVELNSDRLIVVFKSKTKNIKLSDNTELNKRNSNLLNDCYSCGNTSCFKHSNVTSIHPKTSNVTFILDEKWPEYDDYIKNIATNSDLFIVPIKKNKLLRTNRYNWSVLENNEAKSTLIAGAYRALKLRLASSEQNNLFELSMHLDKIIAKSASKKVPLYSTHLVISQNLLPFIYETGILGGRTFDVLMTRLPIGRLQKQLDLAFSKFPNSPTLNDFRAGEDLINLENRALNLARKIITPHTEIAAIFNNKSVKLNWNFPQIKAESQIANKILFPASALARKGAYEMKQLAKELKWNLVVAGFSKEYDNFWEDLRIEKFNGDLSQIGLVIYPTYIEHQPRLILKALANRIPVITTPACGIENSDLLTIVELQDYENLRNIAIEKIQKLF